MSASEELTLKQRILMNDPTLTYIFVSPWDGEDQYWGHDWADLTDLTQALQGNSSVDKLSIEIHKNVFGQGQEWKMFCHAMGELVSLRTLDFTKVCHDGSLTEGELVHISCLLRHTRKYLKHLEMINIEYLDWNTTTFGYLGRDLTAHPVLETLTLGIDSNKKCPNVDSFGILMMAISTIPNLQKLTLFSAETFGKEEETGLLVPMADAFYLERVLTMQSIEFIYFGNFVFGNEHSKTMGKSLGHSNLLKLELLGCEIQDMGSFLRDVFDGLQMNRTLIDLYFNFITCSAQDAQDEIMAEFAQKVIRIKTQIRELSLGPFSSPAYLEPVVSVLAGNYNITTLTFGFAEPKDSQHKTENKKIQKKVDIITSLNMAGRRYLLENGRGSGKKATGVHVLSFVVNDVDCLYYHLRENPSLCDCSISSEHSH